MWQFYIVEDTIGQFPMDDAYARGATVPLYLNTEDLVPIEPVYQ